MSILWISKPNHSCYFKGTFIRPGIGNSSRRMYCMENPKVLRLQNCVWIQCCTVKQYQQSWTMQWACYWYREDRQNTLQVSRGQYIIPQQYRVFKYTKYNDLMQILYTTEEQNKWLIQKHLSRPTSATPLPEANHSTFGNWRGNICGKRGRGRGC